MSDMRPFPDEARRALLRAVLDAGVVVRLFVNDAKVTAASRASDFTPADVPAHTFAAGDWTADGFSASATWSMEFEGVHVLRGWYATSKLLGGALLAAGVGFEVEGQKGLQYPLAVRRRDVLSDVTIRVAL